MLTFFFRIALAAEIFEKMSQWNCILLGNSESTLLL